MERPATRSRPAWRAGRAAAAIGVSAISLCVAAEAAQLQGTLAGAPLPETSILFEQVLENQNKIEAARNAYTYTMTQSSRELEAKGQSSEGAVRVYEVFSVHGKRVQKLVAKDGRPLTADEARKEDERVRKIVRERNSKQAEADEARRRGKPDEARGDDEDVTASDILRVCQFVNARREPFRGQEVLAYDFEPRPGAKARGRLESAFQRLEGSVWIDEQARRILRLEARVKAPIKVAGGLVLSVRPGSSLVFEQELVGGEAWLPSYAEVKLSARFLLLKGYRIHQTQRFSDYKKFSVETSSEIRQVP